MRLRPVPSTLLPLLVIAAGTLAPAAPGPGPHLVVGVDFDPAQLAWPGSPLPASCLTAEPGDPRVPYRDVTVLLPPGTTVARLDVVPRGLMPAVPAAAPALAAAARVDDGGVVAWDRLATDGPTYPGCWGELLGERAWHGYRLATVRLYPRRLVRGEGGVWSGVEGCAAADLTFDLSPAVEGVRRRRDPQGLDARARARIAAAVVNPDLLARYTATPTFAAAPTPTWAPDLFGGDVAHVIVTSAALAGEFQRLADHRTSHGVPTVVATLEEIAATHPGAQDVPDAVRRFLREAYEEWGLESALLGGDVTVVPARRILNTLYPAGTGTEMPVDLYYGGLDGDWNADGDEQPGEPYVNAYETGDGADLAAELAVGRAPVTTVAEVSAFVDKILAYERDAPGPQGGRALFLSEVLFPSDWREGQTVLEDGAVFSEAIVDSVLSTALPVPAIARLYEAASLWPGTAPLRRAAVVDSLDSGRYGVVTHVGHGFFYNLSVGDANLDLKDAAALINGPQYFVLNSLNCSSAAFDYNCILERMVANPYGGAVAVVGSARAAFPGTAGQYQRQFYRELYLEGAETVGGALAASREPFTPFTFTNSPERWTHMTVTLLGDPQLTVWTAAPESLAVAAPDSVSLGERLVSVVVTSGGAPVAGALVCLRKDGEDYARARTGADGTASLDFTVKSGGQVTLAVTARNRVAWNGSIPVAAAPQPYLKVTGVEWRDDGSLGSAGNGDGVPNPGETVAIIPTFTNSGTGAATPPLAVYAWTDAPHLTVTGLSCVVPALAPGATAAGSPALAVRVASSATDRARLPLELVALDGPRAYRDEIVSEIRAADLRPVLASWNDYPGGDGDGYIETGEHITLRFAIFNAGGGQAASLTATVEPVAGMSVVDGAGAWPDLPGYGQAEPSDVVVVRATGAPTAARGCLVVRDATGLEWRHGFDLTVPARPTISTVESPAGGECVLRWQPNTETDIHGYHVYRSLSPYSGFARLTTEPLTGGAYFRDTGLAAMTRYYYQIAAVDTSRLLSRVSFTASASTIPSELAGWPITLPVETSSHCVVGDVDGDGRLDAVLAADLLYAWDGDGVELRDGDGDSQTLGPFNAVVADWGPAGVTLANLTSRPGLEIVASNRTTRQIWVYQGDGTVAPGWPRTMSNWNWATPAVGDLDGDGDLEIVASTVDGRTYVWHHDGTDFFDGDANPATVGVFQVRTNEWYTFCSPALADLDGDGKLEIILGTKYQDGRTCLVHALRNNATDLPGFPYAMGAYAPVLCSPTVGDLDRDGALEIVVVTENDRLHVIRSTGQALAPFPVTFVSNNASAGISTPTPALADFDGDGDLEIVAVAVSDIHTAGIHVLRLDGTSLPGWPQTVPGNSESSPIVGDISGDGLPDVLFGIGGGADNSPNALYAFQHNGAVVPGFPLQLSGPVRPTPTLADLDADGGADLVYGGWDLQMHVWDLPVPWSEERFPWPTFKGNPLRTGAWGQAWVTGVRDDMPAPRLALAPAAPNPFNPRTRIAFDLPGPGPAPVKLTVYDLRGRRVARLVDGALPPGRHAVDWEGRDDSGRPAASGLYFYRLDAGGVALQRRMTLVR